MNGRTGNPRVALTETCAEKGTGPTCMVPPQGQVMCAPTSHHIDMPATRNMLAHHVMKFCGLITVILAA